MSVSKSKGSAVLVGGGALAVLSLAWGVLAPGDEPTPAAVDVGARRAPSLALSAPVLGGDRPADRPDAQLASAEEQPRPVARRRARARPTTPQPPRPAVETALALGGSPAALELRGERETRPPRERKPDAQVQADRLAAQRKRHGPRLDAFASPDALAPASLATKAKASGAARPTTSGATEAAPPTGRDEVVVTEGGAQVRSRRHLARFDEVGLEFFPLGPEGLPLEPARFTYRLEAIALEGAAPLYQRDRDGPGTLSADEAEVRYQRSPAVVEHYRARGAAGVEQVFTLAETPRPAGDEPADLVVRGRVETGLDGRPDGKGGLTFAIADRPQVSFGRAIAIDAGGRVVDAPIAYAAGVLEIRVPGEWLAQAPAGPLVVDPVIGANVGLGPYTNDDTMTSMPTSPTAPPRRSCSWRTSTTGPCWSCRGSRRWTARSSTP